MHRNLIFGFLVAVYLGYGFGLAAFSRPGFPTSMRVGWSMPYLADKPVGEDGFYMLTVAWNLASKGRPLYNFDRTVVGIQPLATAIYAGVAWVVQHAGGGKWVFIRIVLAFGVCNLVVFAHILGLVARLLIRQNVSVARTAYLLTFLATIYNFWLFRLFTYGLETGVYLTLLAIGIWYSLELSTRRSIGPWQNIAFGCLAGLAGLARIDFGLVIATFLAMSVFTRQVKMLTALMIGVIALATVSPWLIWVHAVTGDFLPSSGRAQAAFITSQTAIPRISAMAEAVLQIASPSIFTGSMRLLNAVAAFSLVGLLLAVFWRQLALMAVVLTQATYVNWMIAVVPLIVVYPLCFWPTFFYGRYASPLLVILLPGMAIAIALRMEQTASLCRQLAMVVLPACFFLWAVLSLHTGRIGNPHVLTADFVAREFAPTLRVGAFQSGVVGFFNPNVINLDGKMDWVALRYAQRGELDRYVDQQRIDVLIDWPEYIDRGFDRSYINQNWQEYRKVVPNGVSVCLVRKNDVNAPAQLPADK